jgi:hypothetical protein
MPVYVKQPESSEKEYFLKAHLLNDQLTEEWTGAIK